MIWQTLLNRPDPGHHLVQLYRDEDFLAQAAGRFVAEGLRTRECVIVVATGAHRELLLRELRRGGTDLKAALGQGRLQLLGARSALAILMKDGIPQWKLFRHILGGAVAAGIRSHGRVRVFGEMVDCLWREGRLNAAALLEDFWNRLAREQPFSLMCAYRVDNLERRSYGGPLECICGAHSHVIPARDYAGFNSAVREAARDVLGTPLASMLTTLSRRHKPAAEMPLAQAMLLWLASNMPHTAEKVLAGARARLSPSREPPMDRLPRRTQASASQ